MTIQEQIDKENDFLRSELGSRVLYAWKHSSKLFFRVQEVRDGRPQWDHRANPETGLIELSPVYVDRPMLPRTPDSWLLARFTPADQEQVFKQRFGTRVEYPAGGIWQPIEITALRPGIIPNRTDTWNMIRSVRANVEAVRNWFLNGEAEQELREKQASARRSDRIRNKFTVGMGVPGTKGSFSLFSARPDEDIVIKKASVQ